MGGARIHPTAVVDPDASLGNDVEIGPFCLVSKKATLGDGCVLKNHVVIDGPALIGKNNTFYAHSVIGEQSQDLKYQGEPTHLEIGDHNVFRESVTVHRSTGPEHPTRIGNHNNILAYCHIAHECVVGDHVIFSNNATLAGHVVVENQVVLGGFSAVHQFCRIGAGAMTGGCCKIIKDVPPAMIVDGNPGRVRGYNQIGLERAGWNPEDIQIVRSAYKIFYLRDISDSQKREELQALNHPWASNFLTFIENSNRGITPGGGL